MGAPLPAVRRRAAGGIRDGRLRRDG